MAGRPKGTTKTDARRVRIQIPLTPAEKALVEHAASLLQSTGYADTAGTVPVFRQILLDAANNIVKSYAGSANPNEHTP